jgi:hypothetical protein
MVVNIGHDAGWRKPLCISIDAAILARRLGKRKQALRRKTISLAAVHDPPDKIIVESTPLTRRLAEIVCEKRSAFPAGKHRRRARR